MTQKKDHRLKNGIAYKKCYFCKKYQQLKIFNKGGCWDGLSNRCKKCERIVKRQGREISTADQKCMMCNVVKKAICFDVDKTGCLEKVCTKCKRNNDKKLCTNCNIVKSKLDFSFKNKAKGQLQAYCKKCAYETKKGKYTDYNKKYHEEYRVENREKLSKNHAEYFQKNKEKINEKARAKRKINEQFRIANNLRSRVSKVLSGVIGREKTMEMLGCTLEDFKKHIESQWLDWMTWENHGPKWHIDHIVPVASFDLTKSEERRKCFHYKNMQPLPAKLNLSKNKKHPDVFYGGQNMNTREIIQKMHEAI